jgi:sugar O-acyltransferase (sialic acid O-acetyltransferase NeuD family)
MIEKLPDFCLIGLIDPAMTIGATVLGHPVIGRDSDLPDLIRERSIQGAVVAVGDNWARSRVVEQLRGLAPSLQFPAVIHPGACLARTVRIGRGSVVMAGSIVNSEASIGDFCILNTACSIDHDSVVGDYASVAPKACAGGQVEIGAFAAIGMSASVIQRVRIGTHTVVGAGATVVRELPACVVAYGTPARVIRARSAGEKYL